MGGGRFENFCVWGLIYRLKHNNREDRQRSWTVLPEQSRRDRHGKVAKLWQINNKNSNNQNIMAVRYKRALVLTISASLCWLIGEQLKLTGSTTAEMPGPQCKQFVIAKVCSAQTIILFLDLLECSGSHSSNMQRLHFPMTTHSQAYLIFSIPRVLPVTERCLFNLCKCQPRVSRLPMHESQILDRSLKSFNV